MNKLDRTSYRKLMVTAMELFRVYGRDHAAQYIEAKLGCTTLRAYELLRAYEMKWTAFVPRVNAGYKIALYDKIYLKNGAVSVFGKTTTLWGY